MELFGSRNDDALSGKCLQGETIETKTKVDFSWTNPLSPQHHGITGSLVSHAR